MSSAQPRLCLLLPPSPCPLHPAVYQCSTLMLIESAKDSLSFSVTHYKHPKQPHTVQVRPPPNSSHCSSSSSPSFSFSCNPSRGCLPSSTSSPCTSQPTIFVLCCSSPPPPALPLLYLTPHPCPPSHSPLPAPPLEEAVSLLFLLLHPAYHCPPLPPSCPPLPPLSSSPFPPVQLYLLHLHPHQTRLLSFLFLLLPPGLIIVLLLLPLPPCPFPPPLSTSPPHLPPPPPLLFSNSDYSHPSSPPPPPPSSSSSPSPSPLLLLHCRLTSDSSSSTACRPRQWRRGSCGLITSSG